MKQDIIKSFCIDFNWDSKGPAKPGLYAHADPAAHFRWYRNLGANTIQTFCVSYNGYAWYSDSRVAPVAPGLKTNFLREITELGHREGMRVMGYFCLGSNRFWEEQNPNLTHMEVTRDAVKIPITQKYLDYFCRLVKDALRKTEIDGFMIDWFRPPHREKWLECETRMFRQLMGHAFPKNGEPDASDVVEYERRVIERAWVRIKEAVESVRPAIIWTNHPFEKAYDPLWTGHRLLREVDWVLNEGPDPTLLKWLRKQVGSHAKIIQNLCGWENHDATIWRKLDLKRFGLYGFAQADPGTTLPSVNYTKACKLNQKNINVIRKAYQSA